MLGGMDPKSMAKLMKQMGIKTEEINAEEIRILQEGKTTIIKNPSVMKMIFRGQIIYQISGSNIVEEERFKEEDIELIISKTGCTKEEAVAALKDTNGDIAEAILKITEKRE